MKMHGALPGVNGGNFLAYQVVNRWLRHVAALLSVLFGLGLVLAVESDNAKSLRESLLTDNALVADDASIASTGARSEAINFYAGPGASGVDNQTEGNLFRSTTKLDILKADLPVKKTYIATIRVNGQPVIITDSKIIKEIKSSLKSPLAFQVNTFEDFPNPCLTRREAWKTLPSFSEATTSIKIVSSDTVRPKSLTLDFGNDRLAIKDLNVPHFLLTTEQWSFQILVVNPARINDRPLLHLSRGWIGWERYTSHICLYSIPEDAWETFQNKIEFIDPGVLSFKLVGKGDSEFYMPRAKPEEPPVAVCKAILSSTAYSIKNTATGKDQRARVESDSVKLLQRLRANSNMLCIHWQGQGNQAVYIACFD